MVWCHLTLVCDLMLVLIGFFGFWWRVILCCVVCCGLVDCFVDVEVYMEFCLAIVWVWWVCLGDGLCIID